MLDFIKRYNHDLSQFQLVNKNKTVISDTFNLDPLQRTTMNFNLKLNQGDVRPSKQLQKLAITQEIGSVVQSNLLSIVESSQG